MALPASDDFTRADSNDLGTNWTDQGSGPAWGITSNQAALKSTNADAGEYWNADTAADDQWAQATLRSPTANSYNGPAIRMATAARTRYECAHDSATRILEKVVAGSFTTIQQKSATQSAGDVVKIQAVGTWISGWYNGAADLRGSDNAIASGRLGLGCGFSDSTGARLDDWSGGEVSTPEIAGVGAYTALSTTTRTPTLPAHASGDILLMFTMSRGSSATLTCSTSGWAGLTQVNNGTGLRTRVFWKRAASSSETNPTVTSSVTEHLSAYCVVVRRAVASGDPWDATAVTNTGSSTTMTANAITVATANALLLRVFMSADDNNHGSNSEGFLGAGGTSYHSTAGLDGAQSFSYILKTSTGSTGTATMAQGSNGADNYVSYSILIKPAATGNTYDESITLAGSAALTGTNIATVLGSVSLTGSATMQFSNIAQLLASLGLSANAAAQWAGGLVIDASLGLSANASVLESGGLSLDESVILAGSAAIQLAELKSIDVNVALAAQAGLTPAVSGILVGSATLNASAAMNAGATAEFLNSIGLNGVATIGPAVVVIMGAEATLAAIAAISTAGGTIFDANVDLPAAAAIQLAELKSIDVNVALASQAGLTPAMAIVFEPALSLTGSAALNASAAANIVAALNLAANGALVPLVNAVIEGTLNLAAIGQLNAAGSTFSGIFLDLYGRRQSKTKSTDPIFSFGREISASESIGSQLAEKYKVKISTIIEAVRAKTK